MFSVNSCQCHLCITTMAPADAADDDDARLKYEWPQAILSFWRNRSFRQHHKQTRLTRFVHVRGPFSTFQCPVLMRRAPLLLHRAARRSSVASWTGRFHNSPDTRWCWRRSSTKPKANARISRVVYRFSKEKTYYAISPSCGNRRQAAWHLGPRDRKPVWPLRYGAQRIFPPFPAFQIQWMNTNIEIYSL